MIRWALKLSEFNIEWEHRTGVQNVVADVLSRNPVGNMDGSQISCADLRTLALNSREQLIREQREDPELGHIYRYLENPDDGSVNATVCEGWSQDFKLIDGLLFYTKYSTTLGELRVYIPKSLCEAIMQEFHDLPLAGHLGKRKTYLKLRDTCYFPYMRKYIFEYVSTCDRCQKFNYKHALPAGRLIPIISNYPNEIVTDNGPQFIPEVFEHLSHRLDIKHIKTVTYRPQANLTERVNRTLVQIIACFVDENLDNWDRFLHEFAFALRTSVNETTGKTPAELFLGRKIITPFCKLINVTEGAEYVGGNIEKLFDEARQNMRKQHKTWGKYYNRKRREVNIKVNDLVLVETHFMSAAGRRVVGKFMPKFEGPYRVLEVWNNNLIIWKKGKRVTVNIDQVRVYHPRQSDTISFDSYDETLYEGQRSSNGSSRSHPGKSKGSRKPRVRRWRGLIRSGPKYAGVRTWGPEKTNPCTTTGDKENSPSTSSRNHKYRRPNNPSQGLQSIAGPSHQLDTRQCKPPTEESRQGARGQYERTRETRTTPSKGNSAAERRPVRSRQATAVRPCPYYLRSRLKKPEGIPEEQRSNGIDSLPQNNLRRRSLSMEALDGGPVDRSE
ncbi:transposon Ty3-I Gag-Pol polyprotein [Trichonephila clavipes]|nr:transposon Ty3-I Gag-Pol polyprotein [Trichonephila clavipes]